MQKHYGLILNYKGLCEKNYLYTETQLKKLDKNFIPKGYEANIASNKTYKVIPLNTEKEIEKFLCGVYNSCDCEDDNIEMLDSWSYQTQFDCLFTGKLNEVVKKWVLKLEISLDDTQGVDLRAEPFPQLTRRFKLNNE